MREYKKKQPHAAVVWRNDEQAMLPCHTYASAAEDERRQCRHRRTRCSEYASEMAKEV